MHIWCRIVLPKKSNISLRCLIYQYFLTDTRDAEAAVYTHIQGMSFYPRLMALCPGLPGCHPDITWNALPDHICTVPDPVKLRKLLRSHYFSQPFNIC